MCMCDAAFMQEFNKQVVLRNLDKVLPSILYIFAPPMKKSTKKVSKQQIALALLT